MADQVTYDEFRAGDYLQEFYTEVSDENRFILEFFHRVFSEEDSGGRILDIGGGPTIYQNISASRRADELFFSEYLEGNRAEVVKWWKEEPGSFDWEPFFDVVAKWEGEASETLVTRLRRVLRNVVSCDLLSDRPVPDVEGDFDVVTSAFCIEGITESSETFGKILERVGQLVRPGGHFFAVVVRDCMKCKVGQREFGVYPLTESSLTAGLEAAGFSDVRLNTMDTDESHGYTGIMAVEARRVV